MRKIYSLFNRDTEPGKRARYGLAQRFLLLLRRVLLFFVFGGLSFLFFYLMVETPSMRELQEENSKLLSQYKILSQRLDDAMEVMQNMQERDDNMYRVVLNAEPVSNEVRNAGYGGTNRYDELMNMDNSQLVVQTTQKMDMLAKQIYIQIKSFDELVKLSREQEEYLRHMPAIQPISNRDLKRTASGYGRRIDPVYKVPKFHHGMDFSCDMRTPVYATADGKVVSTKWKQGYGWTLEIDHGYGYVTRYAHLHSFTVRPGRNVVRGEQIALSGNSGKSTGPHLHYEVIVKGRHVNPINYYFMDLDADGYDEMLRMAENHGKVFD
ncbi:MAG: M23 family metallopeptidase [Bacteroidaceae bacterium]|nr:M23 family metallopeptidase [Bacteroidaceae bacterium]